MKHKNIILILLIFVIIVIVELKKIITNNSKKTYYFLLKNVFTPIIYYQSKYFIKNCDKIVEPFYKGKIEIDNKSINISKNLKNEYSLLDKENTEGLLNNLNLVQPSNETLNELLKRISKYIHLDGKKISYQDLAIIDVLNVPGNYFPFFHTDVEWNTYCKYDGFQIWILLNYDKKNKSRGNMFIMETDEVKTGTAIQINKNNVLMVKNEGKIVFPNTLKKYSSLKELKPKIKYLNADIGEVFLMNKNVYHTSDPFIRNSSRRAINLRVIYNPSSNIKICNINNGYSKIWRQKFKSVCDDKYCVFHGSKNDIRFKFK